MGRGLIVWGLLVLPVAFAAAAPVTLNALQGEIAVYRTGVLIPSEKILEGFGLEPFDTVVTGPSGKADVRLGAGIGLGTTVKLDPGTSAYFEFSPLRDSQTVGVTFLAGSLSVVTTTNGASTLEVRTDRAVFSGSKPGFRVVGVGEGDVLVTSRGGPVACRVGTRTVSADADSAVEVSAAGLVRTLPSNAATLGTLEVSWTVQKHQAFVDQLASAFHQVGSDYQRQLGQFQRAWDRYQRDSQDGSGVLAATANLRRAAVPLERAVVTLKVLRRLMDDGVLSPTLELNRGYPAKEFFRQADLDETPWFSRLVEARGFYQAAADRNGGAFPQARDGSSITWDSDYFH
jgi:hypothetical protein